jgi:hypothetical protein
MMGDGARYEETSAFTVMNIWVTALKAVGAWAVKQRLIARNPFVECSVPVPKKTRHRETKAFSADEIRLILSNASAINDTTTPAMATRRWSLGFAHTLGRGPVRSRSCAVRM